MTYSHFQHRHNFAVWCAARAVQRKFAKTPILKKALEKCGVSAFVQENGGKGIPQAKFDELHEQWCKAILKTWEQEDVKGASYGRAAKLVAVYLKSMIVVQNDGNRLSDVAHPPIDRILLQNISKDKAITHPHKSGWKAIAWTALDKAAYTYLIADFKQVMGGKPLWAIEKYWIVQESD
jgi:hypothetical protein